MRALLDLMRDNETAMQDESSRCQEILRAALRNLNILHPGRGEMELTALVAVECSNLLLRQQQPETHSGPFVRVSQSQFLTGLSTFGKKFPTKWLQNRPQIPKPSPGIPPHRAFCGDARRGDALGC